jgi:hypothetical protein
LEPLFEIMNLCKGQGKYHNDGCDWRVLCPWKAF